MVQTSRFFKSDLPIDTFRLIIKFGIDLNFSCKNNKDRTILHIATKFGLY